MAFVAMTVRTGYVRGCVTLVVKGYVIEKVKNFCYPGCEISYEYEIAKIKV